jgi:hypothetical protein
MISEGIMATENQVHRAIILLIFVLPFIIIVSVQGQSSYTYTFDIDSNFSTDAFWSTDISHFTFRSFGNLSNITENDVVSGVILTQPLWKVVNIDLGTFDQFNIWPLQSVLSQTQMEIFEPRGFIYSSVSGRLLAYPHDILLDDYDLGYPLTIADQLNNTVVETSISVIDDNSPEIFRVYWADNDSALATWRLAYDGSPLIQYLDLEGGLGNIIEYEFQSALGNMYATVDPVIDILYDVSPSGNLVLLTARPINVTSSIHAAPVHLIIWSPRQPQNSKIISLFADRTISSASFSPNNVSEILIVSEGELLLYNVETVQTQILNSTLIPNPLGWARFSPNGENLAIQAGNQLHIIDILPLLLTETVLCDIFVVPNNSTAFITAITSANGTPETDTICLEAGTYTLDAPITSDITLHGLGAGAEIIGSLQVSGAGRLTLRNVSVNP